MWVCMCVWLLACLLGCACVVVGLGLGLGLGARCAVRGARCAVRGVCGCGVCVVCVVCKVCMVRVGGEEGEGRRGRGRRVADWFELFGRDALTVSNLRLPACTVSKLRQADMLFERALYPSLSPNWSGLLLAPHQRGARIREVQC